MTEQKTTSRKERERLAHRKEILDAALDLFSENGYVNVTMQEIAVRAEFATGTLYNFFKNKEDLYKALIEEHIDISHKILIDALLTEGTEIDKIRKFVTEKGKIFKEHISFSRLYISEIRGLGFILEKEVFIEKLNDLLAVLSEVFKSGIRGAVFKDLDPDFLAVSLNGISSVLLIQMAEDPVHFDYMKNIDNMLTMFLEGVMCETQH